MSFYLNRIEGVSGNGYSELGLDRFWHRVFDWLGSLPERADQSLVQFQANDNHSVLRRQSTRYTNGAQCERWANRNHSALRQSFHYLLTRSLASAVCNKARARVVHI